MRSTLARIPFSEPRMMSPVWTPIRVRLHVEYVHDREILQLGAAGAPLALLLFRPCRHRLAARDGQPAVSSMMPITTPRPGLCRQPIDPAPDHR